MTEYSIESGEPIADAPDHFAGAGNAITPADQFAHLPLALIVPSLTNPRKTFNAPKLAELAESIKASGVHQPILVRALPGSRMEETSWEPRSLHRREVRPTHEIVAGERRYRAATLAGLATIPAMIRAMTDDQVLECQLVENLQRDDLSPLEEAEGYEHLCAITGISKDDVGAKIGKSRAYVYARIKLLDLSQDCKQALRDGTIDASRALLIARIPDTALQLKALTEATRKGGNGDVISVRDLQTWLQKNVMLRLENAAFKITDARLVKEAGSCKDCPKRTGANPDLFSDVDGADICTDPVCFHGKEAAHRTALVTQAEKKGLRLVEGKEAAEICSRYSSGLRGYLPLSQLRDDAAHMIGSMAEGVRTPTLRDLLGKDAPAPVLIEHPYTREMIEAVPEAEAEALLLIRGLIKATSQQIDKEANAQIEIDHLRGSIQQRTERTARAAQYQAVVDAIRATPDARAASLITSDLLRAWLESMLGDWIDEAEMADLLGYTFEDGQDEMDAISMHLRACSHGALFRALVIHMVMRDKPYGHTTDAQTPILKALYQPLAIDTAAIEAQAKATVKAEVAEKIKALKAEAAPKPAKPLLPLASAAQAEGGGGAKAQSQNAKSPAAPARKKKMSAPEAQAAIAAAMQGQDTDTGAADATQGIEAVSGCALPVGDPAPEADAVDPALYGQALDLITHEQKASVRRLKAELGIGTDKAMDLMDALEKAGKVSSCDERGARKVLVEA